MGLVNHIQNKYISLKEVASILGISQATVRNWEKVGRLSRNDSDLFNYSEVKELSLKFSKEQADKLQQRANKINSKLTFLPTEYILEYTVENIAKKIIQIITSKKLNIEIVIITLSLLTLKKVKLVTVGTSFKIKELKADEHILKEITSWMGNVQHKEIENYYSYFKDIDIPLNCDLLGLVYQSQKLVGEKSQNGSYYTPREIVGNVIDEIVKEGDYILDPCCGTGQFLTSSLKKIKDPNKVWGFDIDFIAVMISKVNILSMYPTMKTIPNVFHVNTLIDRNALTSLNDLHLPQFDCILTNPPWGAHFAREDLAYLKHKYPLIHSNESFSYFIEKSYSLLKNSGIISFILPESILKVKVHRDIRSFLLKNSTVLNIIFLNRVFKGVFTPVIRMDFKKEPPHNEHLITSKREGKVFENEQSSFLDNRDSILNVFTNREDLNIIKKVYSIPHEYLKQQAEWGLGIVTGNNKKHLSTIQKKHMNPILVGKDIKKYIAKDPTHYIENKMDSFQQVAPMWKYFAKEKLVYKFISKYLVFSYVKEPILTLNSANVLIPKIDYPIMTILALLNSNTYQFIYQKKFEAIRTIRNNIENLPLPIISSRSHKWIEKKVSSILKNSSDALGTKYLHEELNQYIMGMFGFTEKERNKVMNDASFPISLFDSQ